MTIKELKETIDNVNENAEVHVIAGEMNGNSFLHVYEVELRKNECEFILIRKRNRIF